MSFAAPKNLQAGQGSSQPFAPLQQFQSSPQGQAISQGLAPIGQAFNQLQNSPVMQGISQAFAPIQNQLQNGMNQSPVFNRLPFARQASVQQPNQQFAVSNVSPWGTG